MNNWCSQKFEKLAILSKNFLLFFLLKTILEDQNFHHNFFILIWLGGLELIPYRNF